MSDQSPPQNIEIERSVLGATLVAEPSLIAVLENVGLAAEDFYLDKHRLIFACICGLRAEGKPVDELMVAEALAREGMTDAAGGRHYISELAASVAAPSHAKHYAEVVLGHSCQRAKQQIGQGLSNGLMPAEAIDELNKLLRRGSQAGADRSLRVLDVSAMVETAPPAIPWVIEGLAIERTLTLLSGKEGEGKSLLSMGLAAGVAQGEEVAGLTCRRRNVLVIDAENGEYEIHRRVRALGLPGERITLVEAIDFHLGRDLARLEALIAEHKPGLVILDSFRSLWPGGDENDSAAAAAVLDPLRNLLRRRGPAGILLHHVSRSGNDYRGNSAIGASIELGFRLSRHQGDPEARERRSLRNFKCRPAPEPKVRWMRLHAEREQVFIESADPFEEKEPSVPKRADLAPRLLAAASEPIRWPDLARAMGREPKDGTARRLRDDLLKSGELEKLSDGRFVVSTGVTPSRSALESRERRGCQGVDTPGESGGGTSR
jgi:RecA-family ATPase